MKKKTLTMVLAVVLAFSLGVVATATAGEVQKTLTYRNIKITINGSALTPKDANGNAVEPFIIDGTTYLPVRAVANALGLDVGWDGATNTVSLSEPGSAPAVPAAPTGEPTLGEKNALETAKSYLSYSSYSYTGLIGQLEYEGYTTKEATYGADNCGADWNEQAAKCAASYMKYSSYSRQRLYDQLIYEGFTAEQAEYGVKSVGY